MVSQFKFLQSNDVVITNQEPPEGISRRHWNMLPRDLRNESRRFMEVYIEGWEAGRNNITINPYEGIINDPVVTEWIELWNRGFMRWSDRVELNYRNVNPDPPIDETYPEFYNTDELIFFDVTEVMFDPISLDSYKYMCFRHIEEGNTIRGSRITPEHPMWNFPDII
jgi:hypothetical protein